MTAAVLVNQNLKEGASAKSPLDLFPWNRTDPAVATRKGEAPDVIAKRIAAAFDAYQSNYERRERLKNVR